MACSVRLLALPLFLVMAGAGRSIVRGEAPRAPACNEGVGLGLNSRWSTKEGDLWKLIAEIPAGTDWTFDATVRMDARLAGTKGPEGWSLSVKHDRSFFRLVEVTFEGTGTKDWVDPGQGFLFAGAVDGEAGAGFVSAVIVSLEGLTVLPAEVELSVLRARYALVARHDEPGRIVAPLIRFEDGLEPAGPNPPVSNIITIEGTTHRACRQTPLQVEVNVTSGGPIFYRGDASNDGRCNLIDPVWVIQWLFFGGLDPVCLPACDANGDLRIDTTDAVFMLQFLFLRGQIMPAPYPRCGPDPHPESGLTCEEDRVRCP